MDKFLTRFSRRKFIVTTGAAALGNVTLKGCIQNPTNIASAQSVPAAINNNDSAALYEEAKKEGKLVWYTVSFTQDIVNEISAAFSAKYPGIKAEGTRNAAQVVFQKLNQQMQAGIKNVDVFSSGDISQLMQLKDQGKLIQYVPTGKENILPQYRDLDANNYYHIGSLVPIAIAYNTQQIKPEEVPKTWKELIANKYKDKITTGSGAANAQTGTWALSMEQKYGWDAYFGQLSKLKPKMNRLITDTVPDLVSGERALAIGTVGQALTSKAKGNPVEVVYPTDGTIVVVNPVGILKDAPHMNAAKLFLNFLMSKEYSQLCTKYFEQPIRSDVTLSNSKVIKDLQIYSPKPEEIRRELPEVIRKWRKTFGA